MASGDLALFATLWALAEVVHLINLNRSALNEPTAWAALLAAFAVLSKPSSHPRLLVLAVAQISNAIAVSPFAADHQVLAGLVNALLLLDWAIQRRGRSGVISPSALQLARLTFLICYGAAVLAKYNSTFLEPVTSCATFIAEAATFDLAPRSGALGWIPIAVAIGGETIVLVALAIPRLRPFGVRFAIAFHMLVAASPVVAVEDFSLVVFAMATLFLPQPTIQAAISGFVRMQAHSKIASDLSAVRPRWIRPVGGIAIYALLREISPAIPAAVVWLTGLGTGLMLLALLTKRWETGRALDEDVKTARTTAGHPGIAVALCALAIVASPYLGLRTTGVFTMFSNLRTEGAGSNHLFLPSFHLTDHQTELMLLSEPWGELDAGVSVSMLEVRRDVADGGDLYRAGTVDGIQVAIDEIAEASWLESKFLNFRPIDLETPQCTN